MQVVNLVKGQSIDLKKADGTSISKIRIGLSWDVSEGSNMDLDLFVVAKQTKVIAYFNAKDSIKGIKLGADNLTGEGDGDDETVDMDATQSDDWVYAICVNIYDAVARSQSFSGVKNASARVYNADTNEVIAEYAITENGGAHTALIVGEVTDTGDNYAFKAVGTYLNGSITDVSASL